jgi:hypothetical protein
MSRPPPLLPLGAIVCSIRVPEAAASGKSSQNGKYQAKQGHVGIVASRFRAEYLTDTEVCRFTRLPPLQHFAVKVGAELPSHAREIAASASGQSIRRDRLTRSLPPTALPGLTPAANATVRREQADPTQAG